MTPPPLNLEQRSDEMLHAFRQLQKNTVILALPALFIAALLDAATLSTTSDFGWAISTAICLLALIPLVWWLNRFSFVLSSLLVSFGLLAAILSAILWGQMPSLIGLFFLPVGYAALSFGVSWGALAASGLSLLLWVAPSPFSAIPSGQRLAALIGIWGALGLIWLTLRPLLAAADWSWDAFRHSQMLLEEARESQGKLHQALEDLTNANIQMSHLNTLANNLRRVAEDERRIKEQFVANVSHELRTPLNMIIGFCEMMLRNPEAYGTHIPSNLLADLQVVLRNSQHLSSLIDDVLDLSQIEARQMALIKEWVGVDEIVQAAVIAVRPLYESKGLWIEIETQSDLPQVYCDRTRIREVLLNLLSNAGRFTEQGGVKIHVWQEGAAMLFSVTDSGPGISEEDRTRLFQPFQQLDASIRRRHGGTGLGLNISKSFVEMHDGKMWVESEKGIGTTFFFRLPIEQQIAARAAFGRWVNAFTTYTDKSTRVPDLPEVNKRPRLLVVEKGSILQRLIRRYIGDVEIVTAPDLAAARHELECCPVKAVLVNDPHANESLEMLLSTEALPFNTPAILCSIADTSSYAPSPDVGDILIKPISYDTLTSAIARLEQPVETVLVVDDDSDAQKLFRRMLSASGQGYQVLRAENGLQALELLKNSKIDLILLDLVMPEMDGFTFLKVKEEDSAIKEIPVILISAKDQRGHPIVSNFLAATCSGGISVQQLLDSIQALSQVLGT